MISASSLRKDGIKLHERLAKDLPLCHVDPRQIKNVILTLINDAHKGMKNMTKNKKIEVRSSLGDNTVVVTVSDSRPVSGSALRKRRFDFYYENRDGNPEIDIGFNIVEKIIGMHKGFFGVIDSKWGGAEFRIELPLEKGEKEDEASLRKPKT
jgi:K+-sensing histidine kinase KdpD